MTAPPTTSPPQNAYIYQGDGGFFAALNAARASRGLQPATGVVDSSMQNCALNFHGFCGTNEAYSGAYGNYGGTPDGASALNSFLSTSTRDMLLQPGIGFDGKFHMNVHLGIAWNPPNSLTGGGFVVVIGVCASDAHSVVYC